MSEGILFILLIPNTHPYCFCVSLDKGAKDVGTGLVGAPACGDVMKLQIQVWKNSLDLTIHLNKNHIG